MLRKNKIVGVLENATSQIVNQVIVDPGVLVKKDYKTEYENLKNINDLLNNAIGLKTLGLVKFKKVLFKIKIKDNQVNDIIKTSQKFLDDIDIYFNDLLK